MSHRTHTEELFHTIFCLPYLRICRGNLPREFAVAICSRNLPRAFAVAICCENLPWLFTVGHLFMQEQILFVYVSKFCLYESKPFLYVNKTFLLVRFSLLTVFLFAIVVAAMGHRNVESLKLFRHAEYHSFIFTFN